MTKKLSITRLLLWSAAFLGLLGSNSNLLSSSQASEGSSQEQAQIPEISTPKIENMIDVGGRKLHCCVYGNGSPAIVLVSGLDSPQENWTSVVPDLARITTVVTYDRAGVGKSEVGRLPTHGEQSAKDLHVLLDRLRVPRPFILIGHSYGGNVVRLFASLYPKDVGGLILEDTQHENVLEEMRKVLKGQDLEAFERLVVERFSVPEHPETEADYRDTTRKQLRRSGPLPQIPFVVLTSGRDRAEAMRPLFSTEAIEKIAESDLAQQKELAALIPGGKLMTVEGAGHYIHVGKPEALIAPVVEMIKKVREKEQE